MRAVAVGGCPAVRHVAVGGGAAAVAFPAADLLVHQLVLQDVDLLLEVRGHVVQFLLVTDHDALHLVQLLIPGVDLELEAV